MSNVEKLKEYLIGENGYLLNEISNGKVIMLSGEWGSGKTHFWHLSDDAIKAKLDQKTKPNIYISLYGKSSLQEIENEVFTKAYYKSKGRDDNKKDVIEKLSSTFSKLSSYVDDVSPIKVTPVIDFLETLKKDAQENSAEELMNEGLIIAFDDFERKSTLVNLNDLFGFITNLTIQYKATIVIILNDDVFEGKERETFTNVKEKTVSKYLKFVPTCHELFEFIIRDDKYAILKNDNEIEKTLKDTFDEVGIVNARILIQVLDNLLEWHSKKKTNTSFYLRYFVLANINFILYHHTFVAILDTVDKNFIAWDPTNRDHPNANIEDQTRVTLKSKIDFEFITRYIRSDDRFNNKFIENMKKDITTKDKDNGETSEALLLFINSNESLIKSLHFMFCFKIHVYSESNNEAEVGILNQINDFIETGIL